MTIDRDKLLAWLSWQNTHTNYHAVKMVMRSLTMVIENGELNYEPPSRDELETECWNSMKQEGT